MSRFKSTYTAHLFPTQGEFNNQASRTVPDQTMSVKELQTRYAQGLPMQGAKMPVYHGDDIFVPDWEKLDLAERAELVRQNRREIEETKKTLQEQQRQKQIQENKERYQKEEQEKLKYREQQLPFNDPNPPTSDKKS